MTIRQSCQKVDISVVKRDKSTVVILQPNTIINQPGRVTKVGLVRIQPKQTKQTIVILEQRNNQDQDTIFPITKLHSSRKISSEMVEPQDPLSSDTIKRKGLRQSEGNARWLRRPQPKMTFVVIKKWDFLF